jgi:hypothetical protein
MAWCDVLVRTVELRRKKNLREQDPSGQGFAKG